ncbi:uncharacterized protein [Aristolochia californica]|uniref:uncharacterized protein isoform X2 n=1 Tax=Aristolochia californica TaxID=171875 RepID=UPI0035DAB2DF
MPMPLVTDFSEQKNSDMVSDRPNNRETLTQSPSCDVCHLDGNTNSAAAREQEKICASNSIPTRWTGSSAKLSANKVLQASSEPQRSNLVFSRRKQHNECEIGRSCGIPRHPSPAQNGKNLPGSEEKGEAGNQVQQCNVMALSCGQQQSSQKSDVIFCSQTNVPKPVEATSKSVSINQGSIGVEATSYVKKLAVEYCSSGNFSCCSTKSNVKKHVDYSLTHVSAMVKNGVDDTQEYSSSDFVAAELSLKDSSEKEICVSTQPCASADNILGVDGEKSSRFKSCKACGSEDSRLNMLICDLCEGAFHLRCCTPRVRKITFDEWYCRPCSKKKPKPLLEVTKKGKATKIVKEMSEYRKKLRSASGLISFMLSDTRAYNSRARIGKEYQAEVPEWSGPISDDTDEFREPTENDPVECTNSNGWNSNQSSKQSYVGNWLQCREIIYQNTKDGPKEAACGKWRRAPFFEVQTDQWDCSCSLPWDPTYADCAVPQYMSRSSGKKRKRAAK